RRQRECAVGLVFGRLVETARAGGEGSLQRVDAGFPDLNQAFAERLAISFMNPGRHGLNTQSQLLDGNLEMPIARAARDLCHGHGLSLNHGCTAACQSRKEILVTQRIAAATRPRYAARLWPLPFGGVSTRA